MIKGKYTWIDDVVVEDDPNKEVAGYSITIHNQGTTLVKVGERVLLPDDQMEIISPEKMNGSFIRKVLKIKFLGATTATTYSPALSPQLYNGNRLLITEIKKYGEHE